MSTRYIFGFDAGTSSGAWSIIDTLEKKIVGSGMFPNTPEEKRSFADKLTPYVLDMEAVLEDVIPSSRTMTANLALKGSVMFMEGVLYTLYDGINIYYVDPAKNTNHPLGCWLKEFGLLNLDIDISGLNRKEINKKNKEAINERTIEIVRELYSNADEFLSKGSKKEPSKVLDKTGKSKAKAKIKKPDPNIATSILIAEFRNRKR